MTLRRRSSRYCGHAKLSPCVLGSISVVRDDRPTARSFLVVVVVRFSCWFGWGSGAGHAGCGPRHLPQNRPRCGDSRSFYRKTPSDLLAQSRVPRPRPVAAGARPVPGAVPPAPRGGRLGLERAGPRTPPITHFRLSARSRRGPRVTPRGNPERATVAAGPHASRLRRVPGSGRPRGAVGRPGQPGEARVRGPPTDEIAPGCPTRAVVVVSVALNRRSRPWHNSYMPQANTLPGAPTGVRPPPTGAAARWPSTRSRRACRSSPGRSPRCACTSDCCNQRGSASTGPAPRLCTSCTSTATPSGSRRWPRCSAWTPPR